MAARIIKGEVTLTFAVSREERDGEERERDAAASHHPLCPRSSHRRPEAAAAGMVDQRSFF